VARTSFGSVAEAAPALLAAPRLGWEMIGVEPPPVGFFVREARLAPESTLA